jgi:hypothetical protein
VQCGIGRCLALDAVFVDDAIDHARRLPELFQNAFAISLAEQSGNVAGHDPEPGIDQPDIAPGAAETDFRRFQNDRLLARLGQMERRRTPGIAAPMMTTSALHSP